MTANKREQRLNDVGITAAVLGGDALKQQQISSLAEIATRVPSLSYASAPNGTPVYTLRGVGFYETSIGAYPSVSIYLDEVPLSFPVLTNHSTFDLERVEILKGPQGTLFGQNSTGGAINYIVAKPTEVFTAGAQATYGRFNQLDLEGFVSGPLSDTLLARFSGRMETADGWQVSDSRHRDRNGRVRNYMGRLQLGYDAGSGLRLLFNANGWKDKSQTQAAQFIALQFQNENLSDPPGQYRNAAVASTPFSALNPRSGDWTSRSVYYDHRIPFADNRLYQLSLRGDLDIGDFGTVTSITAYTDYKMRQGNDTDGLALRSFDAALTVGRIKSFNQELRFANDPGQPVRFVVGGNFSKDSVDQNVFFDYPDSSARIAFDALFGAPIDVLNVRNNQDMRNIAGFSNIEADVAGNLTLKAGVRYTNSRNKAAICQGDPLPPYIYGNLIIAFSEAFGGPGRGTYTPDECASLNLNPATFAPVVNYAPFAALAEYRHILKEDNISWRLGADYKLGGGALVYLNVSKGYKAGSFPTISGSNLAQYNPARQEAVMAYEGGVKTSLLNRRLQANVAAFYYDYSQKQLRTKLNDPIFGQLDVLQNIPKSSVKGAEAELTIRLSPDLTATAAYTYLDATIDRYVGVNAGGDVGIDFSGTEIPYTPKHQASLGMNYERQLGDAITLFAGANVNMRSSTISTPGGRINPSTINDSVTSCVYCIRGYTLVDGQIGIRSTDRRWQAFLWGKNIFNSYYWSNVVSGYDIVTRYAGRPATYGMTFVHHF
ncbi:TonB-dependent receptor [Sphingobium bisphenolivorans]|uniref:TonB-dependent receptor n=1 Tax=Sphingobium bisphenolivorans TaxID=1335760 RepID=UPI00187CEAD4|nr:TonB-dependent receptor [Sphingobium bisphenolivorans]